MSDDIIRTSSAEGNHGLQPGLWLSTIAVVKNLILDNHPMIAILGEKGGGKTTFANLLQTTLSPDMKTIYITASPLFNRSFFLDQLKVMLAFDAEPSIANFIAHNNQIKAEVLIIIDDAHFLSAVFIKEILAELQKLEQQSYFNVCLVSDISLVSTLNRLKQDIYKGIVHRLELGPLSEAETKMYVQQHLFPSQPVETIVTDDRVKAFYQLTAGHIAAINRQMTSFFINKKTAGYLNETFFRMISLGVGILFVAIGLHYIWQNQDFQSVLTAFINQKSQSVSGLSADSIALNQTKLLPHIEPVFISEVPYYEVGAVRQPILPTPLRRSELVALDDMDGAADNSLVIMDKVIVLPKIVQQKNKPVIDPVASKLAIIEPIIQPSSIPGLAHHHGDQ